MNMIVTILKRINDWVAVVAGIALLGGILLICAEIVSRALSVPFSISEEISAISWHRLRVGELATGCSIMLMFASIS